MIIHKTNQHPIDLKIKMNDYLKKKIVFLSQESLNTTSRQHN